MTPSSLPHNQPQAAAALSFEGTALLALLLLLFVGSAHAQHGSNRKPRKHADLAVSLHCHRSTWPTTAGELACNILRAIATPQTPE